MRDSASPQLEDGYTRLSNELLEALMEAKLTARQWAIVMSIARKTYGFNKKEDDISASQIGALCAMHRVHATETLNQLERMNIINKRPGTFGCIVSIQKDYELWIDDPREKNTEPKKVARVSENHYTYMVTHEVTGEFYIGVRSCKCHPNQDRYKGSGNWVAQVGVNALTKKILKIFKERAEAEEDEIRLIREFSGNHLMRNVVLYLKKDDNKNNNSNVENISTHNNQSTSTESVQGVQEYSLDSTGTVTQTSTDSVHTKDNSKDNKQKKVSRDEITFNQWIEKCKNDEIEPIPATDAVFVYADEVGLSIDYIRFAWVEFKRKYSGTKKRYKSWNQHFQNAVRENWYGIWFDKAGTWELTTRGKQVQIELEGKKRK